MNPTIDISSLQSNVKYRYNYLVTYFFEKKEKYENLSEIPQEDFLDSGLASYYANYDVAIESTFRFWAISQATLGELIELIEDIDNLEICDDCHMQLKDYPELDYDVNSRARAVCSKCFEENYTSCEGCECTTHIDNVATNADGDSFCGDCYYEQYAHCDHCGIEMLQEDAIWEDYNEVYHCHNCYRHSSEEACDNWEVIDSVEVLNYALNQESQYQSYMSEPQGRVSFKKFKEKPNFEENTSRRFMGLEIEVHNYASSYGEIESALCRSLQKRVCEENLPKHLQEFVDRNGSLTASDLGFKIVSDGSINGIDDDDITSGEIVLDPRQGSYLLDDSRIVTDALKQYFDSFVTSRTGLHLHIDSRDFDWYHRAVLSLFTKMFEPHLYSWLAPSRIKGTYSRPMSQTLESFTNITDKETFLEFWYDTHRYDRDRHCSGKRYHSLNMHPSFCSNKTGSIELRYHQGTLNANKIKHWAILWGCIFDKCKEMGDTLYSLRGDDCIKWTVSELLDIPLNIEHTDILNEDMKKLVENEEVFNTLRTNYKSYYNPCIDIHNLFDVMEVPMRTRMFYTGMLDFRLRNSQTPTQHYTNCFFNNTGVVYWDRDALKFRNKDFEIDTISSRDAMSSPLGQSSVNFYPMKIQISDKHIENSLLSNLLVKGNLLSKDIIGKTYKMSEFSKKCHLNKAFKYRVNSDEVEEEISVKPSQVVFEEATIDSVVDGLSRTSLDTTFNTNQSEYHRYLNEDDMLWNTEANRYELENEE